MPSFEFSVARVVIYFCVCAHKSENNSQESLLSFHHVGLEIVTPEFSDVASHLVKPLNYFLKSCEF